MEINPIIYLVLIVLLSIYACNDDEPIEPIDELALRCQDQYGPINKIACDFEFRKGKWVEIQDSLTALSTTADTIHFMQDSLIGWSIGGDPYNVLVGYFYRNTLYKQLWDAQPNDPVSTEYPIGTEYIDSTDIFVIHWNNGLQNIYYSRLD